MNEHAELSRYARMVEATSILLACIDPEPMREGLMDTPKRVAAAWSELVSGYAEDPAAHLTRTFQTEGDHGIVVVRDIPFYSLCEHHLLPFIGTAAVAYIPNDRIVGLSKVARCVRGYARRLQVQERLTEEIADAVDSRLDALGTAVVIRARHLCMEMRGVKAAGAETVTSALRGAFRGDPKARAEVMELLR